MTVTIPGSDQYRPCVDRPTDNEEWRTRALTYVAGATRLYVEGENMTSEAREVVEMLVKLFGPLPQNRFRRKILG